MGGPRASKPSKLILIKARSTALLSRGERGRRVAERRTRPGRKKQVAVVMVGVILSILAITSRSQAHLSLPQTWEASSTTSSVLQTSQNIKRRLGNGKGLLRSRTNWVAGPAGNGSSDCETERDFAPR